MKTAMQELIEKLKAQQKILEKEDNIVLAAALYAGQRMAEDLLEKEKEQIIDAYDEGIINGEANEDGNGKMFYNLYYNQTYNQNK